MGQRRLDRRGRRLLVVGDAHQIGGVGRLLQGFRDHERDVLAVVAHEVVLQDRDLQADLRVDRRRGMLPLVGQLGRVRVRDHREHAGARSAAAASIPVIRPLAIVLWTMAP